MAAPNDALHTRQVTMSEFQWGQLSLLVRNELRLEEQRAEMARKLPDRKVARARAEELRDMQQQLDAAKVIANWQEPPAEVPVETWLGETVTLKREGDRLYIEGHDADDQGRVWMQETANRQNLELEVRGPSKHHKGRVFSPDGSR